jgi:iron complex outermembrane receptor protein
MEHQVMKSSIRSVSALCALLVSIPTLSQQVVNTASGAAKNRILEEVMVTAQKREQSQQEVPIAIQAFGGGALEALGIEDTTQLGRLVPSLQFSGVAGYTLVYLRGVGTDAFAPSSDPSVATYIDGVYMPSAHGVMQSFGGIERVEVLKGPQGSLFGRNSTGGAISVVTKEPHATEVEVELSGELTNYDGERFKAYISTPIGESLSISLSAINYRADEYYTQANRDLPSVKTDAGRLKISFRPTENLDLNFAYFKSEQRGVASAMSENNDPSPLGRLLLIQESEDDYYTEADYPSDLESEQEVYYGSLYWQLPWFDFKLIGSDLLASTVVGQTDFDGSPVPLAAFSTRGQYSDYQTIELQFLSNENNGTAEYFEWIAGLYYLESEVGYDPAHLYAGGDFVNGLLNDVLGLPANIVEPLADALKSLPLGATPLGETGLDVEFKAVLGTKSSSAFTQTTIHLSDSVDITLGGRYQEEERYQIKSETGLASPDGGSVINLFKFPLRTSTVTNFSPKVVLSFTPSESVMLYASWSKGFKSATYNLVNIYEESDYVFPEEVTQYELGMKSEWLGGQIRLNGAIFQITIDDLQSGFVSLLAGGAVTLENAGQAQIEGAEFDITLVPFPSWNPGFVVSGNMGFLDAVYTDYQDGAGYDEDSEIFRNDMDFTGNDIVRTPELSGGIALSQAIALGTDHEIEFGADYYYNSGFAYTPQNTVLEPSYSLINARASYLYIPWDLRLTAFSQNIEDTRYHFSKFQTDFGVNQTLSPPRQYGLRLQWAY